LALAQGSNLISAPRLLAPAPQQLIVLESLTGVFTAQTNIPPDYRQGIASIGFQRGILLTGGGSAKVDIITTCSCGCS